MASEDSFLVLVHHRGSIKRKTRSGMKFTDKDPLCIIVRPTTNYDALVSSVLEKLGLEGVKRVKKFYYRIPTTVLHDTVNSGGSNRNPNTIVTVAGSSSRPAVASSSVPVNEPAIQPVASPSFAVDLNGNVADEVRYGEHHPTELRCPTPAGVGEGLFDDPDDDDVEPDMIADDSGDDLGASDPRRATGGSSSGTQQYPPYFSSLDLDAMRHDENPGQPAGFGARDTKGSSGMTEFQCSEFGNGCTWLIRLSLRQRKGIWEVKRYNRPHTCLATSISSDHRSLDYHVIATFIMPMVRADASVNIKVLLNATAAHFGFRPTYRRVWMAKQKAVAIIYGDWDESYNELPQWVLGVQLTMPGTIAVLRTCPVRVGGQLDESQAYFHRLFWTFPLDGNSNILPVAFALVEGENAESWSFFLSHLRQHVTHQPGLLVISDRHNGIKAALEAPDGGWLPPAAYRAFCIRHVAANFALTFKGKDARRLLVNAA
ncbi:uncharacterized protein LOC107632731 [Arachis ipaensis]|uniref:uncharacterized protein LOC107632731 n=1 Tax=Arachis ipaensis TaxID=130454 RepID=UPI0007AFD3D5|nr:uncharacterized protein LOC107632731 [Arachis ipaensis]XP_025637380.1 uncharacterized protein LOC112732794 [Arachis hypogaea]